MPRADRARLGRAVLPVAAIAVSMTFVGAVLAAAGSTLGYDFLAYYGAARRVLDGQAVYDLGFQRAGGFGLFLYPPTFLPVILPFGLLGQAAATWAWVAAMVAALVAGIRLLPVPVTVRWVTLLLAGLSWPVAYTLTLGQVTPLLFLLAVLGWRAVEDGRRVEDRAPGSRSGASAGVGPGAGAGRGARGLRGRWWGSRAPVALGVTAALGAAVKIQPGLLLAWALLGGRWCAVAAGVVTLVAVAAVATIPVGVGAWFDYVTLIRQVTDPVGTEHNITPAFVARGLGLSADAAGAVQLAVAGAALLAMVVSVRRVTPAASYLVALTASQLISPVLWDHYAVLLLLPVAWLMAHGRRWAVLIPLATSLPLVWLTPLAAYPVLFAITLVALLWVGGRAGSAPARPGRAAAAADVVAAHV